MVFSDVMTILADEGYQVSEGMLRWAVKTGKVPRPELDGSHRFVFLEQHVTALKRHFQDRRAAKARRRPTSRAAQNG